MGAYEPEGVRVHVCILQSANAVNAAGVGAGIICDCTGTVYITGKVPGVDEILNLGSSLYNTPWLIGLEPSSRSIYRIDT